MQATHPTPSSERPERKFPIVCVGGSAGGLDAYIRLLKWLPGDLGVAIVIVNHMTLMPTQLHTILPRHTTMPVDLASDDLSIEPDRAFITPENRNLPVDDGEFHLQPISKPRGWPDVITIAQKPSTAAQPDMPQSAIDTGCIDFVLAPEDIALEIRRIASVEA